MLDDGIIYLNKSYFSSPVVMVYKKFLALHVCANYRDLKEITIKDKFPTHVIDELLDELHKEI